MTIAKNFKSQNVSSLTKYCNELDRLSLKKKRTNSKKTGTNKSNNPLKTKQLANNNNNSNNTIENIIDRNEFFQLWQKIGTKFDPRPRGFSTQKLLSFDIFNKFILKCMIFNKNETIINETDIAQSFFIILKGSVVIRKNMFKNRNIATLFVGDFFGANAYNAPPYRRTANVIAASDKVYCLQISYDFINEMEIEYNMYDDPMNLIEPTSQTQTATNHKIINDELSDTSTIDMDSSDSTDYYSASRQTTRTVTNPFNKDTIDALKTQTYQTQNFERNQHSHMSILETKNVTELINNTETLNFMNEAQMTLFIKNVRPISLPKNTALQKQGKYAQYIYLLPKNTNVTIWQDNQIINVSNSHHKTLMKMVGYNSVRYEQLCKYTICIRGNNVANTSRIYRISKKSFNNVLNLGLTNKDAPKMASFLHSVPIFSNAKYENDRKFDNTAKYTSLESFINDIAQHCECKTYLNNELIVNRSEYFNYLFIVKHGQILQKDSKYNPKQMIYLRNGELFGAKELLYNKISLFMYQTVDYADIVLIPKHIIIPLIQQNVLDFGFKLRSDGSSYQSISASPGPLLTPNNESVNESENDSSNDSGVDNNGSMPKLTFNNLAKVATFVSKLREQAENSIQETSNSDPNYWLYNLKLDSNQIKPMQIIEHFSDGYTKLCKCEHVTYRRYRNNKKNTLSATIVKKQVVSKPANLKIINKICGNIGYCTRQVRTLRMLDSPFIPRVYGIFEKKDTVNILMESCLGGTLAQLLNKSIQTDDPLNLFDFEKNPTHAYYNVQFYAASIVLALQDIHSKNMIYRNLILNNVRIDQNGYIKLYGFQHCVKSEILNGHSNKNSSNNGNNTNNNNIRRSKKRSKMSLCAGMCDRTAPEVFVNNKQLNDNGPNGFVEDLTQAIDWWMLGIILCELCTGINPFHGINNIDESLVINTMTKRITLIVREMKNTNVDSRIINFVKKCFKMNSNKRLKIKSIVENHPFFKDLDWQKLELQQMKAPFVPKLTNSMDSSYLTNVNQNNAIFEITNNLIPRNAHKWEQQLMLLD